MLRLKVGDERDRDSILRRLVEIQYTRNDMTFTRGTFRVRGDTLEIFPVYEEHAVRVEFFGDEIERLMTLHPVTGEVITEDDELYVFPATHYVAGPERMERAIGGIETELEERLATFERQGKLLEAQRLRMRTTYDVEMMRQVGSCAGIENYSMHIDGRGPRQRRPTACSTTSPRTSCSSSTSPTSRCRRSAGCTRATCPASATWSTTASGCPARWTTGRCGGRSSSSGSARPIYLSATPGNYELDKVRGRNVVEQIIRPTGLIDPEVVVKPTKGQIDDLIHEIHTRVEKQRAGPGHHADQEDVRGPHRLPPRRTASAPATCTPRSTPSSGSSCCATCGWASTTCWSASTCCARASTCPRCRWSRSSTPTRRASCAPTSR